MDEVESKIIEIIAESLELDKSRITLQSRLAEDLGADSIDQVEIVMAIDAAFHIETPDDAASKIITISDAVEFVKQKLEEQK